MTNDDIVTFSGAIFALMVIPTLLLFAAGTKASKTWMRVVACFIPLAGLANDWNTTEVGLFTALVAASVITVTWAVWQQRSARYAPPTI